VRACDVIAGAGVPNWLLLCPYASVPTRDDVFAPRPFFIFWTSLPIQVTDGSGEVLSALPKGIQSASEMTSSATAAENTCYLAPFLSKHVMQGDPFFVNV
jgi:hypothetical protein